MNRDKTSRRLATREEQATPLIVRTASNTEQDLVIRLLSTSLIFPTLRSQAPSIPGRFESARASRGRIW